jgi:hypothetical protein
LEDRGDLVWDRDYSNLRGYSNLSGGGDLVWDRDYNNLSGE